MTPGTDSEWPGPPEPAAASAPPPPPLTAKQAHELAKKQAMETRQLAKKQAEAKRDATAKKDDLGNALGIAELDATHAKEKAALREKHRAERAKVDPLGAMPVFNGMAVQDAVAALHAELTPLAAEHNFQVGELRNFGLEFDVFDPVSGLIMSPARAHRRDSADAVQFMSPDAVVSDIVGTRRHQAAKK